MVLKKVLGFATTTSFILLVMIAPTTAAAATTTASLQQQEDNATTTIDEPNSPIEPPAEEEEEEEEPREPIPPDNENNDTGDIGEPPIAEEPIGPANETGGGGEGNVTTTGNVATTTDTWINSVRTPEGKNIPSGGSTISKVVTVDFQSTATDTGKGSHVDLKIDSGSYVPVASPRTITGLSDGPHTIYLKAVNQAGKADPTPAQWKFTVINDDDGLLPD